MLLWIALLGALYVVFLIGFWSLCRMSATRPRRWTLSFEEEEQEVIARDSEHRDATVTVLSMGTGRALGI